MTNIIDRTNQPDATSGDSRAKFIARHKADVVRQIRRRVEVESIKNLQRDRKIRIRSSSMDEPSFEPDSNTGKRESVRAGNKKFKKGHVWEKDGDDRRTGTGAGDHDGDPSYVDFELSKKEFLDLLFEDLALPNYLKETLKKDKKFKRVRAGVSKDGVPSQLNVKKTFEKAIARRLSAEAEQKREASDQEAPHIPFLDDVDLRYNWHKNVPYPVKQAVMFCLMDSSGSMTDDKKLLAKHFYLLLYLFLEKNYQAVDIVFLSHDVVARELDEQSFFNEQGDGGTLVSSAIELMLDITKNRYKKELWNIYVAQVGDGDNSSRDTPHLLHLIEHEVLPIAQYFAYIQVQPESSAFNEWAKIMSAFGASAKQIQSKRDGLLGDYAELTEKFTNFSTGLITTDADIFPVLKELFRDK